MRIITLMCRQCDENVAANELENQRAMKCPGLDCEAVMRFSDLNDDEQDYFLESNELYRI